MKNSISKLVRALMASLVLISAAFAPQAEAGYKQGGKQRQQPNYANRDIRANDVRSASINNVNRKVNLNRNVNVNRDINVNVHGNVAHYNNRGCCNNRGWDDNYHPIATAAAVAATVAVTSANTQRKGGPQTAAPLPFLHFTSLHELPREEEFGLIDRPPSIGV